MGLKGLLFLGILIATYLLIFSEVAARELAETPIANDPAYGYDYGSICSWGCCGWANDGCTCCFYFSKAGRHAKLP